MTIGLLPNRWALDAILISALGCTTLPVWPRMPRALQPTPPGRPRWPPNPAMGPPLTRAACAAAATVTRVTGR